MDSETGGCIPAVIEAGSIDYSCGEKLYLLMVKDVTDFEGSDH